MYESYLALGGVEIANVDRLVGYAKSVGCSVSWLKANGCGTLRHALGDELPYTHETIDQAPWYDQSQPDLSSRFLGIMVIDQKGLSDSSRQASLTEGIVDGGTIGGQRRASREARFRVLAVAEGDDALDYGIAWLSSALDADKCGQHGGRCGVTDLEFFTTCPEEVSEVYAGDVLVPDTPEHVIEGLRDQSTDLEPIVNYAPEIKGDETWRVRARNLFTNPNLVGSGMWAEVRRNKYVASGIGFGTGSSIIPGPYSGGYMEVTPGEVVSFARFGEPEGNRFQYGFTDGVPSASTPLVGRVNRSNTTTEETGVVVPDGVTHLAMYFGNNTSNARGFATSETVNPLRGLFDGSSPDFSVDPDMRQRWLGTPNASESVMEIETVVGLSGNLVIAGVSAKDGKPAARLIPTGESNNSFVYIDHHGVLSGTLLGTLHVGAPLDGGLNADNSRRLLATPPNQRSAQPPNEEGSYPLRLIYDLSSVQALSLRLYHGGTQGSGDVWWTDIGLFAGDLDGSDAFSGDTEPERPEWRYGWEGEPNSSVSVWEEKGTWASVYENLFPNPRLKGDGTWAEVRRNLCKNPYSVPGGAGIGIPNGSNPTLTRSVSLPIPTPDGRTTGLRGSVPSGSSPTSRIFSVYNLDGLSNTSGVERSVGAWFMADAPGYSAYFSGSDPVALEPNEWKWVTTGDAPRAGDIYTIAYIEKTDGDAGASDNGYVTGVTSVAGTVPPEAPFDGSTTPATAEGIIQPEDFRWRWLGTPNASESVMEGERVAGVNPSNGVTILSSWEGKPAIRQIPLSATGDAFFQLTMNSSLRPDPGTLLATVNLKAPLTNIGNASNSRTAYIVTPLTRSNQAPNEAGSHPVRLEYAGGTGYVFNDGNRIGGGDVWWTDIGLYAGNYPYDTFNGESDPAETGIEQPEDFRIRWTGQPDASTSVMEGERVSGMTSWRCLYLVSNKTGKSAVRAIPTGESSVSEVYFPIPTEAREGGTVVATIHLDEPTGGPFDATPRQVGVAGPTQWAGGAPNLPGQYQQRLTYSALSSLYRVQMRHGGRSGDVWWTDIALVPGEYSGPAFNADTGWFQVDNAWYYATRDTDGHITAYPGRAIFTYPTDDIKRFMHDVATVSGPLLIEELPTASSPFKGAILEFTIASERGYIYTPPRELSLAAAELSAAADQDINLIKNPAFETALPLLQPVGYNLATNPSVETDATNWSASGGAGSRSTLASAYGDYSYLNQGTGSGATINLATIYSQAASIPGDGSLAGRVRKLTLGMWAAASISSGSAQPGTIGFHANINGVWHVLEVLSDTSQFGGYYFMHEVDLPSDWDGNISLRLQAAFPNSGTSTVRLFADGAFIGLGGV